MFTCRDATTAADSTGGWIRSDNTSRAGVGSRTRPPIRQTHADQPICKCRGLRQIFVGRLLPGVWCLLAHDPPRAGAPPWQPVVDVSWGHTNSGFRGVR